MGQAMAFRDFLTTR